MFQIKICGIRTVSDALWAMDCGADAIGLNFHRESTRCVEYGYARQIADAVSPQVLAVGVFVNWAPHDISQAVTRYGLAAIQLHGDETPESLLSLPSIPIIRAFRCDESNIDRCLAYLEACDRSGRMPDAILVDAWDARQFGGTGCRVKSEVFERFHRECPHIARILAGGLTAENVADAIQNTSPDGIDVASGVESVAGVKDPEKVQAFVEAARSAFASR